MQDELKSALIATDGRGPRLYLNSAGFKTRIDLLVDILFGVVTSMADAAEAEDAAHAEAVRRLKGATPSHIIIDDI